MEVLFLGIMDRIQQAVKRTIIRLVIAVQQSMVRISIRLAIAGG